MEITDNVPSSAHTGQAVREARATQGISLRELARRIEVSPGTVSAIETGKTRIDVERLHAIASAMDLSVTDLLAHRPGDESRHPTRPPRSPSVRRAGDRSDWRAFDGMSIDPVLMAAIDVFVERGYHGSTVRSIAQRAQMSVPGVYHHYRSKQELLVACLDISMTELLWRVPAARRDGATPAERVARMVESLALFHTHRRNLALIGASEMRSFEPANRRRIAALRTDIQRMLDEEIDAGIADGTFSTDSPRNAGRAIATMCTSLPQWFRSSGAHSPERIAAEYARFALGLLGHRDT